MKCFLCSKRLTKNTVYECDCGETFCKDCLPEDCGFYYDESNPCDDDACATCQPKDETMDNTPRINEGMFTSRSEEWATPQDVFNALDKEFNFRLDAAATHENAKVNVYFTKSDNGLSQKWEQSPVFLNPPYGKDIYKWMKKAYDESQRGATVVCLVHSRTDTKWWHECAMKADEIRFVQGRIKFGFGGMDNGAPFPSCIVVFRFPGDSDNYYNSPRISSVSFK